MHEYYAKRQKKYLKKMRSELGVVSSEIEQAFHKSYFEILREAEEIYINNFLEDMPYIGGNKSMNNQDLTDACFYAALYEVGKKYGVSVETVGKIANDAKEKLFEKIPSFFRGLVPKIFNTKLGQYLLRKFSDKSKECAGYEYSWLFDYEEPDEIYSHKIRAIRCGTCKYFRDKNIVELLPYICNLDYVIWGKMGLPMYRENALGYGDDSCTMYIKRNEKIPDTWPPHGLRRDGLK